MSGRDAVTTVGGAFAGGGDGDMNRGMKVVINVTSSDGVTSTSVCDAYQPPPTEHRYCSS